MIMLDNSIEEGSSIPEAFEIDVISEEFFGIEKPQKILIVEGESDRECIKRYFYLKNIEITFEIRTASVALENCKDIDGKKKALQYFDDNLCSKNPIDIKLLLDRDYDFVLQTNRINKDIFYYDFYELENYLFDIQTFKEFLLHCYPKELKLDAFQEVFEDITNFDVSENFLFIYYLRLYRELNYYERTNKKIENIVEYSNFIKKFNYSGVYTGKDPEVIGESLNEKVSSYIENKLNLIEDNLFNDIKDFFEAEYFEKPESFLEFSQFYFKGKILLRNFSIILKMINNNNAIKSNTNIVDLLLSHLIYSNKNFENKMKLIVSSF
jgi:hypothetical protein